MAIVHRVPHKWTVIPISDIMIALAASALSCRLLAGRIGHVEVIRPVAGHELVTRDAVQPGVDDWPLRTDLRPPAICLFARKSESRGATNVRVQFPVFYEDAAPDQLPRFSDSLQRAATQSEIHRRLTFAGCPGITANKV